MNNHNCGRCDKTFVNFTYDYMRYCDICEKYICFDCIAITGWQTPFGICRNCINLNCAKCNKKIDDIGESFILDDDDDIFYCDECSK
jgi:hypothetical protein